MTTRIEALTLRFLERCSSDLSTLQKLQSAAEAVSRTDLKTLVHQMSGAATAFGFPQLSTSAMCLDKELAAGNPPSREHVQALIDELRSM